MFQETTNEVKIKVSRHQEIPGFAIEEEIIIAAKTDPSNRAAPMFIGAPGTGKTAFTHKAAQALGGYVLDVNCTSLNGGDIPGIPDLSDTSKWDRYASTFNEGQPLSSEDKVAIFRLQKALWHCTEQYEVIERNKKLAALVHQGVPEDSPMWRAVMDWQAPPVIFFLDDFHKASPSVSRAINALLDDRRKLGAFGEFNLRDNVVVALAANAAEHGVRVNASESDVTSRVLRYQVVSDPISVLNWMKEQKFRLDIVSFLEKYPALINPIEKETFRDTLLLDNNFPSSRGWTRLNADLNAREKAGASDEVSVKASIQSLLGSFVGGMFYTHYEGLATSMPDTLPLPESVERIPLSYIEQEILVSALTDHKNRAAPYFIGPPGAGKTALVHKAAKALNGYVLDVNCTALQGGDIPGIPDLSDPETQEFNSPEFAARIDRVREQLGIDEFKIEEKIAVFRLQKALWQCTEQYEILEREKKLELLRLQEVSEQSGIWKETENWQAPPVILFLDDFHKASPSVSRAINALLDDRRKLGAFGEFNLRTNVVVALAGNAEEHGVRVNASESDVTSRVKKYRVYVNPQESLSYMREKEFADSILGFLSEHPYFINPMDEDNYRETVKNDTNFPCPRSWARLNAHLKARKATGYDDPDRRKAAIHGTIGTAVGNMFFVFEMENRVRVPGIDEILADPSILKPFINDQGIMLSVKEQLLAHAKRGLSQFNRVVECAREFNRQDYKFFCLRLGNYNNDGKELFGFAIKSPYKNEILEALRAGNNALDRAEEEEPRTLRL